MKKIKDRFGNEFYINLGTDEESHIINIENNNKSDTILDDNIQDWNQMY